jgi:hypothetical protein
MTFFGNLAVVGVLLCAIAVAWLFGCAVVRMARRLRSGWRTIARVPAMRPSARVAATGGSLAANSLSSPAPAVSDAELPRAA